MNIEQGNFAKYRIFDYTTSSQHVSTIGVNDTMKMNESMIVTFGENQIALTSEIKKNNHPVIFLTRDYKAEWSIID